MARTYFSLTRMARLWAATSTLCACFVSSAFADNPRILTIGDSMLVWNFRNSIPQQLDRMTNASVTNRAAIGATMLSGEISRQFYESDWDIVIVNGGGNDLLFGCGCLACDRTLNSLISEDGRSGAIVDLLTTIKQTVPRVIYVGYLRSPGVGSAIEHCADEGNELEGRIHDFMAANDGMDFVSLTWIVPDGDRSFHSFDMIHPSSHGSRVISMVILDTLISAQ